MAELIKEPYELSIWERKPSGERFLMTIGSDSMTSPYKANNPIVRTNVNGEKVLSFTLYTKFFDNEIGEFVKNPFIDYLHNEVLLKLHRGLIPDKGWSEFIVKDIQENSETKTYTYTAKNAWALELGKTGYGLNFNSELMNNTGTALSLTEEIFKGTDWVVSMGENVKFWGSKIEPVYTATLTNLYSNSVTCIRQANVGDYNLYFSSVQSDVKIPGKTEIETETETAYTVYIPYSSYQNYKETGELQFLWSPNDLYETDTNGLIYTANSYITTSFEINDTPKIDIAKKGEYLQNKNKTIYLKNIDRAVTEGTIGNKEAYHFVETSYLTNDTVQELIVNGRDFESTLGWRAIETGTSISLDYENLELEDIANTNYNAKLIFKNDSDSSKYIYNAAIRSNATILGGNYSDPKGIAAGDQFVLESDQNLTIIFAKYETQTKEGVTSVNFINKVFETTITGGTTNIVSCSYGISYSDLLDGDYGLFIEVPTTDLSISYLSFYKYIPKSNNEPVTPYDIPEAFIINEEIYILKDDINDSITSLKDIVPYKLKTGETFQSNNYGTEYEKISSINISKSNRFNALQEVCEAFECWADLVVEHEANGTIKEKKVILKNFIGDNKDIGFSYGLNLKSINRQLVSDQIVTKLIVEQNNNENGKNGFCTIVRAKENKSKLNSIYDFSYYINQGILSQEDIEADFYDENGLISQIGKQNKNILILNEELAKLETAKFSCEKDFSAAKEIKEAAELEIERLQQNYKDRTNKIYNGNFEDLDDKQKTDSVIKEIVYCIKSQNKLLEKQTKIYNDNSSKLSDYQDEITEAKELIENHLLVLQDLINQFENKYASFIQEGTWSDESYFDDDLYYYDAQNVLYTSTFPKVTYTINVIDISVLSEQFTAFKFNIGDKTYIEDIEYFGWDQSNTKPYREEVVVSQLEEYLDSPENNKITVQNYKTQFEDLFQRIAATTQSLQYSAGAYQRAANKITSENEIDLTTLQNSLMAGLLNIQNMGNLSISWTEKGMIISSTDSSLSHKKMRLSNTGLDLSTDGGLTWRNAITGSGILADEVTSGTINANKITIKSGEASAFIWDAKGLRAYETKWKNNVLQSVDYNTYIEFNDNGLIAYKSDGTKPFKLTSNGQLELTGKITAKEGYIGDWQIVDGALMKDWEIWLIPGGRGAEINGVEAPMVFKAGRYFGVDTFGNLYASGGKIGGWTITAGGLKKGTQAWLVPNPTGDEKLVIDGEFVPIVFKAGDNFKVTTDGKLYATGADISGHINAGSGSIGGWMIDSDKIYNTVSNTNTVVWLAPDGIPLDGSDQTTKYIFYAGGSNRDFRVDTSGKLYATGADISGHLEAQSGKIGNWHIIEGIIRNNNKTIWLASDDELTGLNGTVNDNTKNFVFYANGNFGVDIEGKLYASEAQISGHIEAGTGTIGHWNIDDSGHLSSVNSSGDGIILNAFNSEIYSQEYKDSTGSNGWMINNEGAVFNNITLRGALKCAVLEYAEVQAVGGIMMIRPATTIKDYEIIPIKDNVNLYTLVLTVENNELFTAGDWCKLTSEANGDILKTDSKGNEILYSGINVNLFQLDDVIEETIDDQIVKKLKFTITSDDRDALVDKALVGMGIVDLGKEGSIGLGLNSSTNSAMIPQTSFSVFSLEKNSNSDWKYLKPHIILGKIPDNEKIYGNISGKYGLYADAVHLKGTIYATGGQIGNMEIAEVENATYRVVVTSSKGTSFIANGSNQTTTLTCEVYKGGIWINETEADDKAEGLSYQWFEGETPLDRATSKTYQVTLTETGTEKYSCQVTIG